MARPRFSEMLIQRRRQLGLSIQQASNVLRLKEQVLIAFEEGDFASMPKSGYAQGMLASYARYLGMNVRQVVNQYSSDLYEYEHMQGRQLQSRAQRARSDQAIYEDPNDGSYVESRGLLPTSGGYAGDLSDYATVSSPRSRSNYPQSSPLVQSRSDSSYRSDYAIGTSRALPEGNQAYSAYPNAGYRGPVYEDPYYQEQVERRYTSRDMSYATSNRSTARAQNERRLRSASAAGYASRYQGAEGYSDRRSRDRVTTRNVRPEEFQDDLRYDRARPYEAASTINGRNASKNIASIERPNVKRRRSNAQRAPRRELHSGVLGVIEAWFEDPRRAALTAIFGIGLILTIIIVFSVSSCMANKSDNSRTVEVSSSSANTSDSSDSSSSTDSKKAEAAAAAAAEAAAAKAKSDEEAANTETKVKVEVADGQVSWVEIVVDGKSMVAEQVTGPWSQEYTVTDQMTVEVSDVSAVTVTKNGEQLKFDSKTSGIGSITIEGTKVTKDENSDDAKKSTDSSADESSNSENSSTKTTSDSTSATSESSTTTKTGSTSASNSSSSSTS